METTYKTVGEYIERFPKETQEILEKVRKIITSVAPDSTEGISYKIPTFYLKGAYVVYVAGFKKHISVYPATADAVTKVKGLSEYKVSKGTLRFPLNKSIPFDLIKKFVQIRFNEVKALHDV